MADGQARFTMLETLREYALERLTRQGEAERLRDWHAWYYLREAEAGERGLRGPQQLVWLANLATDRENFRAALEWSLQRARAGMRIQAFSFFEQESLAESRKVAKGRTFSPKAVPSAGLLAIELCLRLASALRHYWEWQGNLAEARHWLGAALAVPLWDEVGETVLAARAKALSEASRLVCLQNDQTRAVALAEESIALWRQLDDPIRLASTLLHRGWAAHAIGEKDQGGMSLLEGNCTVAIDCLLKSLKLCYELDHKQHMTTGMCLLSTAFGMSGKPDPASASIHSAQLEGVADSLEEAIGLTPWTKTNPLVQMIRQHIRSQVDEQSWQAAWTAGRALTVEQAIDLVCRLGEDLRA
jgi:hypothetical protein